MTTRSLYALTLTCLVLTAPAWSAPVPPMGEYWYNWVTTDVTTYDPQTEYGTLSAEAGLWTFNYVSSDGSTPGSNSIAPQSYYYDPDGYLHMLADDGGYTVDFKTACNQSIGIHTQQAPDSEDRIAISVLTPKHEGLADADVAGSYSFFSHVFGTDGYAWTHSGVGTVNVGSDYRWDSTFHWSTGLDENYAGDWSYDSPAAQLTLELDAVPGMQVVTGMGEAHLAMRTTTDPASGEIQMETMVRRSSGKSIDNVAGRYLMQSLESVADGSQFWTTWGELQVNADGTFSATTESSDSTSGPDTTTGDVVVADDGTFTLSFDTMSQVLTGAITEDDSVMVIGMDDPNYSLGIMYCVRPADWINTIGDANNDEQTDDADYTLWADNYGQGGATWQQGDFNLDGTIDDADYTLWADNYGATSAETPEPMTLALLAAGAATLLRRRRLLGNGK